MFTGLIQAIGEIVELKKEEGLLRYAVAFPHKHLALGASVSIEGVCQTVAQIEAGNVWFDAVEETLKRTTLDSLHVGQHVNIERAARLGDEIGGHILSGHIYGTAQLSQINGHVYTFNIPSAWTKYLFSKGYIAIDGISLTLVDVDKEQFSVHLIPETLQRTTLGKKKVGDRINLEFDALTQAAVETIERIFQQLDRENET